MKDIILKNIKSPPQGANAVLAVEKFLLERGPNRLGMNNAVVLDFKDSPSKYVVYQTKRNIIVKRYEK